MQLRPIESTSSTSKPLRPVIFSMQLEDSARCLHAFSVPNVLSIFTMGGS